MLIPYNTDAPLYHWPIATVGLIVVNFAVYVACTMAANRIELADALSEEESADVSVDEFNWEDELEDLYAATPWERALDPWVLHYGKFRPWEWITSNFIHGGILHLIGNMAVLWGLGLIVEGKVGWWRFVLIFLAIGIGECALEQALTFWMSDGSSYGASAIIFGLAAIALIWAPRNDVSCVLLLGYVWLIDVSLIIYAAIVLTIEVVMVILSTVGGSLQITSAVLHLFGAVIGAVIGAAMVKLHWVDCEGYDLFAVMAGREGQQTRRREELEEKVTPELLEQRQEMALNQIRHLIAEGQAQLAHAAHQRTRRDYPDWQLPAGDYLKLITAYHKQELWADSIPLMVHYLKNHEERIPQVRLQLAKILIEKEDRPTQAEAVMAKIDPSQMNDQLRSIRGALLRKAQRLKADGTIEAAAEDW